MSVAGDALKDAPAHDVIYYDGACGMCRRTTRLIRALDWLHRLDARDMRDAQRAGDLPVPWESALGGMPMRTRDGRALVGFPAARRALAQTPLGAPLALLLYLPIAGWLGGRAYNAIARRRRRAHECSVSGGS